MKYPHLKRCMKNFNSLFSRDKKIVNLIKNTNKSIIKKFIYKVKIKKQRYLKMVKDRYISTLLDFTFK
jgi:hypothetical protein